MKAIYVSQTSCSGDEHTDPIYTYDDDNQDIHKHLKQLQDDTPAKYEVTFYIGPYEQPPHNPKTVESKPIDLEKTDDNSKEPWLY